MARAPVLTKTPASPGVLLQVLDALPAAAYTCDAAGLITYFNRSAVAVWGRAPRLNDGADRYSGASRLFHADGRPMPHDECWMARTLRTGVPHNGRELLIEQPDGSRRSALAHANPLLDADGRFLGASNVLVDITDRKRIERRLAHRATHDALTGLPNRALLLRRLDDALALAANSAGAARFALLLLDLDRFKQINDTFGHEYGDEVLRQVRGRLQDCVAPGDTVARLGGDEFGILLARADEPRAVGTACGILAGLTRPIVAGGRPFDVGASIGIALHPEQGRDGTTLLRHADVAMYAAKRSHGGAAVYRDDQIATTPHQLSMAGQLRRAIEGGRLVLHYQPKLDLGTMRVAGVEALVRWPHPREGLIAPGDFLPMAEANGMGRQLDLWILRRALDESAAWERAGLDIDLAVNIAAENLQDPGFLRAIGDRVAESGGRAGRLILEVTEGAVMADPAAARATLDRLRALGVRIALDDFGTGYSSLSHLRDLRVDEVKIDRSFVADLPHSRRDACIVRSLIDLAHGLNLQVVAEGVEHHAALDWLIDQGCDQVQGNYITQAIPADDLVAWADAREPGPAGPRRKVAPTRAVH